MASNRCAYTCSDMAFVCREWSTHRSVCGEPTRHSGHEALHRPAEERLHPTSPKPSNPIGPRCCPFDSGCGGRCHWTTGRLHVREEEQMAMAKGKAEKNGRRDQSPWAQRTCIMDFFFFMCAGTWRCLSRRRPRDWLENCELVSCEA